MFRALFASLLFIAFLPSVQAQVSSEASKAGLGRAYDPLDLNASVALVADADTKELIYSKNASASLPVASLTKLMAAVAIVEAGLPLDQPIQITTDDYDHYKNTRARLAAGEVYSRRTLLQLALMSSANTAAAALGRTYPGGMQSIVESMNRIAKKIGMQSSHFVETTGLSADNRSSANDLALLVIYASQYDLISDFSTAPKAEIVVANRPVVFKNTNKLVGKDTWAIQLQKTGFINEAGRCLVMKAKVGTRNLVIVLLDSSGRQARFDDADRIRRHLERQQLALAP